MKLIFTKNKNKTEDKHPNFRAYLKDANGDVYQETYKKRDGSDGLGWASVGALWASNKNGEQYLSVDLDMDKIKALQGNTGTTMQNPYTQENTPETHNPFDYNPANDGAPLPNDDGIDF